MRRYRPPPLLLLVCAGTVLGLAGCEEPARRVKGGGGAAAPNTPPSGGGGANPRIGQTALEIEGTDADGKPFKLSDYRGKVVVLDFWGGW